MLNILNKQELSNPEQAEWFVNKTLHVLFIDAKAKREYFSMVKAYFNPKEECCIVRATMDETYEFHSVSKFLYIMLDYKTKEKINFGRNLEYVISDKEKYISWIHGNEVLTFYPDENIMKLLAQRL